MKKKKRETQQVTLRIDMQLLAAVDAYADESGKTRTEIFERAIHLAVEESRHHLSAWQKDVRNAVNNATKDEQRVFSGLAIAMVENEFVKRSPVEELIWEMVQKFVLLGNDEPHARQALDLYTKRGRQRPDAE